MPHNEINLEDYEEIIDPVVEHLAICHKAQGYSANNWGDKPLMLKSKANNIVVQELRKALKQVRVELSMQEFLRKFFSLWEEDAATLAKILGFDIEGSEWVEEYADEKAEMVTLLKSVKSEEDFFELEPETQDRILDLQVKFEKSLLSDKSSEGALSEVNSVNLTEENKEKPMSENTNIDVVALQKQLEDLKAQNDLLMEQRKEDQLLSKSKGLSFVEDHSVVVDMLKSLSEESVDSVFELLEKAGSKINELEDKVAELEKSLEDKESEGDIMNKSFSIPSGNNSEDYDMVGNIANHYTKKD